MEGTTNTMETTNVAVKETMVGNYNITDGIATENIDVTGLGSFNITYRCSEGETLTGYDINITNGDAGANLKWYQTKQGAIGIGIASSAASVGIMIGLQVFKKMDPFGWFGNKRDRYDRDAIRDVEDADYREEPED